MTGAAIEDGVLERPTPVARNAPRLPLAEAVTGLLRMRAGGMDFYEGLLAKYGDVARLNVPKVFDMTFIFHPEDLQYVLKTNAKNYWKGARYIELERIFGKGLVNSEGELWKRQRVTVGRQFHTDVVRTFAPTISRQVDTLLTAWDQQRQRDINDDFLRLAFGVASEVFFGVDLAGRTEEVRKPVSDSFAIALSRIFSLMPMPIWLPTPENVRFRSMVKKLDTIVYGIIDTAEPQGENVLARLLRSTGPDGKPMSRKELRDEIMTILIVGHDTTGLTLTWLFHQLALYPDVEQRCAEEVRTVLCGRDPGPEDLERLPYLRATLQETMRLLPTVPIFLRSPLTDDSIRGVPLRANAVIGVVPWVTHRHPDFWKEPQRFDPERFLAASPPHTHPYAYIPFAAGQRRCIGEYMAEVEVLVTAAKVLQRFRVRIPEAGRIRSSGHISLRPVGPVLGVVEKRA